MQGCADQGKKQKNIRFPSFDFSCPPPPGIAFPLGEGARLEQKKDGRLLLLVRASCLSCCSGFPLPSLCEAERRREAPKIIFFFYNQTKKKKIKTQKKKKKTASEPSGAQSASFVSSDRAERRGAFCLPRPPLKLMIPLSKRRGIKPVYYLTMLEQQRKGKKNFFFFLTRPSPFSPLSQQEQKTSLSIDRFALPF